MFKQYMKQSKEKIDIALTEYLNELTTPYVIAEGMRYSVLNGGKRLRPILLLMGLNLFGKDEELGIPTGCAIEMIHSYSLVHDDLPALDNDTYRRGNLTTHVKFGEAQGILIGDALLTHAFNILTEKNSFLSSDKIVEIIRKTSEYSGINGMIGGQMVDIESEGKEIEYELLKYIHKHKTGKLIKLPLEIAAIIAGATKKEREAVEEYGELIGLAFQIQDDILDVEGDFEKLGKAIGADQALQKSTYPSIFGMPRAKEILNETLLKAKKILEENFSPERGELLNSLADYLLTRES